MNQMSAVTARRKPAVLDMLYFAYGSNLNLAQFEERCPHAEPVRALMLAGHKLVFRGVADIVPAKGRKVAGALYRITDHCEAALDRYEGWPRLYRKTYKRVSGQPIMWYTMNDCRISPPMVGYLATILRGFSDWRLDVSLLAAAVEEAQEAQWMQRREDWAERADVVTVQRRPAYVVSSKAKGDQA